MKALIAGGGTGGHIYPAIAIAEKIKRKQPESEILFVGARHGMEKDLVPAYGFPIRLIDVRGFSRKNLLKSLSAARALVKSIGQIKEILDEFKPDIAIGSGGYVSGPVVRTAAKSGVRSYIMEQNAWPGLSNLMAEKYAEKVFVAFEEGKERFKYKDKLIISGNPIRKEFQTIGLYDYRARLGIKDNEFAVLCFGGSLGAKAISDTFSRVLENLHHEPNTKIFFITGSFYFQDVIRRLQDSGISFEVIKSDVSGNSAVSDQVIKSDIGRNSAVSGQVIKSDIGVNSAASGQVIKPDIGEYGAISNENKRVYVMESTKKMHEYMAASDLIISRSGAITVSEIAACGKASILIPSPNVTGNHQYYNACTLADREAAIIILEKDLSPMKLLDAVMRLKNNKRRINEMSNASATLGRFDASDIIYDYISAALPEIGT